MNVLKQINYLTNKQYGLGIPMRVIGKYIGCHPTTISYYLNGKNLNEETQKLYENGIQALIEDFKKNMME